MKRFEIRKPIRLLIIIINALILLAWSFFVFFWYMVITSDIPPAPTVKELAMLNRFVVYWLLILIGNGLFVRITVNRGAHYY